MEQFLFCNGLASHTSTISIRKCNWTWKATWFDVYFVCVSILNVPPRSLLAQPTNNSNCSEHVATKGHKGSWAHTKSTEARFPFFFVVSRPRRQIGLHLSTGIRIPFANKFTAFAAVAFACSPPAGLFSLSLRFGNNKERVEAENFEIVSSVAFPISDRRNSFSLWNNLPPSRTFRRFLPVYCADKKPRPFVPR